MPDPLVPDEDARWSWYMGGKFMGRGESWKKRKDDGRAIEEVGRREKVGWKGRNS